jgi:hypothetical protein
MVTVGNVEAGTPGRTWWRQGEMPQGTASGIAVGLAGLLLAACGLAGCGAGKPARSMGVPASAAARSAAASQPRPITLSRRRALPGHPAPQRRPAWDITRCLLWLGRLLRQRHPLGGGLWPRGVIEAGPDFVAKDGSVGMRFGWWRAARGKLTITGRRLDAPLRPWGDWSPTATAPSAFRPAVLISRPRVVGRSPGCCPQAA